MNKIKIDESWGINKELFKLLAKPLGLSDECINFSLDCQIGRFPIVRQEYYVGGKFKEIRCQEDEITELEEPMSRNNEY